MTMTNQGASRLPVVEIYHRPLCDYCALAKAKLKEWGIDYQGYDIWAEPSRKTEMVERANGKSSVPQIFIHGVHLGGCQDLLEARDSGRLAAMLASSD